MFEPTQLQRPIEVTSDCQPQPWIQPVQPLIDIPLQIRWEEELSEEEFSDLMTSLEDLRAGRYDFLGSELTDGEFLRAVHKW